MPKKVDAEVENRQLIFFVIIDIVLFRVSQSKPVQFSKIDLSKLLIAVSIMRMPFKDKRMRILKKYLSKMTRLMKTQLPKLS